MVVSKVSPSEAPEAAPDPETTTPFEGLVPGRVVFYWPTSWQERASCCGPWPAMVTQVGENGLCTLNVNLPMPTPIGEDPVQRMSSVPHTEEKLGGCWSWPRR